VTRLQFLLTLLSPALALFGWKREPPTTITCTSAFFEAGDPVLVMGISGSFSGEALVVTAVDGPRMTVRLGGASSLTGTKGRKPRQPRLQYASPRSKRKASR